jgi:hypothetical protein
VRHRETGKRAPRLSVPAVHRVTPRAAGRRGRHPPWNSAHCASPATAPLPDPARPRSSQGDDRHGADTGARGMPGRGEGAGRVPDGAEPRRPPLPPCPPHTVTAGARRRARSGSRGCGGSAASRPRAWRGHGSGVVAGGFRGAGTRSAARTAGASAPLRVGAGSPWARGGFRLRGQRCRSTGRGGRRPGPLRRAVPDADTAIPWGYGQRRAASDRTRPAGGAAMPGVRRARRHRRRTT